MVGKEIEDGGMIDMLERGSGLVTMAVSSREEPRFEGELEIGNGHLPIRVVIDAIHA